MAYSARSVPAEYYIYDDEQASESQWGPILNNTTEDDTKGETKEEKPDEGKSEEDKSDKDKEADDYDRSPFYKMTIDDEFSFISSMLGDGHLSTSPNDSSGGSDVSHDMEEHNHPTNISGLANTSRWCQSSDRFSTTEEYSDSNFSPIRSDSGTSGDLFSSYSTSPESHLARTTPGYLGNTASSDTTTQPVDDSSSIPSDDQGSYAPATTSRSSATGDFSTIGGSPSSGDYATFQYGDSSSSGLGSSSTYRYDALTSNLYGDSTNTGYEGSSVFPHSDLSSPLYEGSSGYTYGGTSNSAYVDFSSDLLGSNSTYETSYPDPYDSNYGSSGASNPY